jgi:hypothetical protein
MAERIVPESRLGREQLRPAAAPQDTFEAAPRDSSLLSLAESLKDFAPAVGGVMQAVQQNRKEKAREQEVERTEEQRQAAQLSAFNMGLELEKHLESLSGETDPNKINEAATEFVQEWELKGATGNANFDLKQYRAQAEAVRQRIVGQATDRASQERKKQTEQQFGELVGAAVKAETNWSKPEGRRERIAGAANVLRERAFSMGIKGSRLNELMFESIAGIAIGTGNPELAESMADIPTGPNGSSRLGDIPEYQEKIARAVNAAEAMQDRSEKADDKKKKDEGDGILQAMNAAILQAMERGEDPAGFAIAPFKQMMNNIDSNRVNELETMRQSFSQGFKRETVPVIEESVIHDIYDPETPLTLQGLYERFELGGMSGDTYLKLRSKIESRDRVRATRKGARPDLLMTEGLRMIGEITDGLGGNADIRARIKGQLRSQLRTEFYEWLTTEEGQKASPENARAHARLLAETLTADFKKRTIKKKPAPTK